METRYYDDTRSSSYSMTKVFGWMFYAILITAIVCIGLPYLLVAVHAENLYNGILIGGLIAVFLLSFLGQFIIANAKSKISAISVFTLFAIAMGIWISPLAVMYEIQTLGLALVTTSAVFGIMALYGLITKRNLSGFGSFLFMLLFGCLIMTLINIFVGSTVVSWVTSYIILAIYIGFIAYDVQRVKRLASTGALTTNISLLMALNLYIDFVYVFIRIVSLIGNSRNN